MPDWAWGVITPLVVLFVGWLFKRAMTSVVDERMVGPLEGMHAELVKMNGQNSAAHAALQDRIQAVDVRVARIEGR